MSTIAVVLIHGIGEQRPMATLRDFVSDVFGPPRSKPDKLSDSFEVRRLDVKPNDDSAIHCYEFYWAHYMRNARFGHLATWLIRLFRTPFKDLKEMSAHLGGDKYLKAFFIGVAFILLALVVTGVVTWAVVDGTRSAVGIGGVLVAILLILGRLIWQGAQSFVLRIVTDAARYLDNTPENIGERQKIRAECVQFLGQLNRSKDPKYDRIVVIGHSLGSVIAYDALKFLWAMQETHASLPRTVVEQGDPIATDGALLRLYGRDAAEPEEGPMRQAVLEPTGAISSSIRSELFKKLLPSTEWKISHLVTVGSPLTHAPILLAQSLEDFWELQRQRELPHPRREWIKCFVAGGKINRSSFTMPLSSPL